LRAADSDMPRTKPSPPTIVLFVRHGETPTTGKVLPGQAPGLHLSDRGRAQVGQTAEAIARLGEVAAVYTSPMERTRETATAIAEAIGVEPVERSGLLDPDTGEWTGQELKALYKLPEWRTVLRQPSRFRYPGGESVAEVTARVLDTVNGIVAEHPGQLVVAVSHSDAIRIVLASALGSPVDLWDRIAVGTASISAVAYGPGGSQVLCMNSSANGLPVPKLTRSQPGRRRSAGDR
jgi:probable phosphoglycerate mutase